MAVSQSYREFVLEQLGRVAPVTGRSMFGGVGIVPKDYSSRQLRKIVCISTWTRRRAPN